MHILSSMSHNFFNLTFLTPYLRANNDQNIYTITAMCLPSTRFPSWAHANSLQPLNNSPKLPALHIFLFDFHENHDKRGRFWTGAADACVCAHVRACTRWQQWRSDTTLAHHLCVCEGLPGDACVYLLIWPAVTLMGFGCKHLISFKIWTFIVDITHRSCMQNMSNSWTNYLILHNISKVAPSPDLASLQWGHCVVSVLVPIASTTQMGFIQEIVLVTVLAVCKKNPMQDRGQLPPTGCWHECSTLDSPSHRSRASTATWSQEAPASGHMMRTALLLLRPIR